MPSKSFEEVDVWKKAHAFVISVYTFTEDFPRQELFGLSAQLRRAAVSIPANFAEGFKRRSQADKARMYNIAQSSLEECRYYLRLSRDLGYGDPSKMIPMIEEVSRMMEQYVAGMLRATQRHQ